MVLERDPLWENLVCRAVDRDPELALLPVPAPGDELGAVRRDRPDVVVLGLATVADQAAGPILAAVEASGGSIVALVTDLVGDAGAAPHGFRAVVARSEPITLLLDALKTR